MSLLDATVQRTFFEATVPVLQHIQSITPPTPLELQTPFVETCVSQSARAKKLRNRYLNFGLFHDFKYLATKNFDHSM